MDFEERAKQRRRRLLKVAIAEIGMIFSVVMIVIVATMASLGFFVSNEGKIEQNGLIQMHSHPSGATIELDGGTLFSRTNASRTLAPGQHSLKFSKDGYDTWENTVSMYPGILLRLYHPRLFPKGRTQEVALRMGEELEFYSPSNDHEYIIYAMKDSPKWQFVNIHDTLQTTLVDLTEVLPGVSEGVFQGEIRQLKWDDNSSHVLAQVSFAGKTEWILVTLRNVTQSLNLTKTFGLDFSAVTMIDDSAAQLFALENGQLRKINTSSQEISRVLLPNIEKFASYKANVIYVATKQEAEKTVKQIGIYRDGERGGMILETVSNETVVQVALMRYYDDDYIIYSRDQAVSVYYGGLPSYRETGEVNFADLKTMLQKEELSFVPDSLTLGLDGIYAVAQKGTQISVIDPEMGDMREYTAPTEKITWLASGMLTATIDDAIVVWDYDNTNQRTLVKYQAQTNLDGGAAGESQDKAEGVNEKSAAEAEEKSVTTLSPVKIHSNAIVSDNNKWLYYLVETNSGIALMRERIE